MVAPESEIRPIVLGAEDVEEKDEEDALLSDFKHNGVYSPSSTSLLQRREIATRKHYKARKAKSERPPAMCCRMPPTAGYHISCILISVIIGFFVCFRFAFDSTEFAQPQSTTKTPRACSYDDLYQSFGIPHSLSEGCVDLKLDILEIPSSSIINRNDMQLLGHGRSGAVFKALIGLQHEPDSCQAALKTDLCWGDLPCVAVNATRKTESFMGGEYTGAYLHYAYRKQTSQMDGILPTYAMVTDKPSLTDNLSWGEANKTLYPDPSIVGAILPLRTFKTLLETNMTFSINSQLCATFLPAVQGLEFMHRLGFSHQDIQSKNVGIGRNQNGNERAFLFDFSYLARVATPEPNEFCPDEGISKVAKAPQVASNINVPPLLRDFKAMSRIIVNSYIGNDQHFRRDLEQVQNASGLVQVLKRCMDS